VYSSGSRGRRNTAVFGDTFSWRLPRVS
jgi:hypothetical protein